MAKHYKESDKNEHKHNESKKTNKLIVIIRLFFIILIIISTIYLIQWIHDNNTNAKLNNHLSQFVSVDPNNSEGISIDYDGLKRENNYFFAWLIVNGTEINYPVVHYKDNDYYLTHSFDNSNNNAGCPFADFRSKCDGTDKNLVIYAHNRMDR